MPVQIPGNVRIVLVSTTHPGNIGATARAMKTMGADQLALVSPKMFPSAEVTARAAGADDILAQARVYKKLQDAIAGCSLVMGTSARARNIPWPVITPELAARRILVQAGTGTGVAVVFGRESSGLSNEEIDLCNTVIEIPTNPDYSSLNVAAAVQIVCYELRKAVLAGNKLSDVDVTPPASSEELQLFYDHLEQFLADIDYYDPDKPRLLMRRLKRLFNRTGLDENEYNILMGILAAARKVLADGK